MFSQFSGERVRVCRNENLDIRCDEGRVIVPRNAFYGRHSINVCPEESGSGYLTSVTSCAHHDAMSQVVHVCFNKSSCNIKAESMEELFEIPEGCMRNSQTVSMYLEMEYTCVACKYKKDPKYHKERYIVIQVTH